MYVRGHNEFKGRNVIRRSRVAEDKRPIAIENFLIVRRTRELTFISIFRVFSDLIYGGIDYVTLLCGLLSILIRVKVMVVPLFVLSNRSAPVIGSLELNGRVPFTSG